MKRKVIIFSLTAVFILSLSLIAAKASKVNYPESQRPKGIADSVVWNPDLGEYYNSDNFIWNPEIQGYQPKEMNKPVEILNSHITEEEFIVANSGTTDEVDKAVVKYYKKVRAIIASGYTQGVYGPGSSNYDPKEDPAFNELTSNLKIEHFPNMISKIKNKHTASCRLMNAINEMANIHDLNKYVSTKPELWLSHLKQKSNWAELKVKESAEKLKDNSNDNIKKQVKEELKSYGLFVLPYIMDEISEGNIAMIDLLPDLVGKYSEKDKDELSGKSKDYWEDWFKEHSEDIKALKTVVEEIK